jgi:hypothetical protein
MEPLTVSSSAEDEMPTQLHSARPRTTAATIKQARRLHTARIYQAADGVSSPPETMTAKQWRRTGQRLIDETLDAAKVERLGSQALDVVLTDDGTVHESMTILAALTRADRVHAVVYRVKVGTSPMEETVLQREDPLRWLACDFAARNL